MPGYSQERLFFMKVGIMFSSFLICSIFIFVERHFVYSVSVVQLVCSRIPTLYLANYMAYGASFLTGVKLQISSAMVCVSLAAFKVSF